MLWHKKTFNSKLFTEKDFYSAFLEDVKSAQKEVIIESPFITSTRMKIVKPILTQLLCKGIKVHIITRDPAEHNEEYRFEATEEILDCSELGVHIVLLQGNHHRKLAVIDRSILWEGSLNILSQTRSREIMRRIENQRVVQQLLDFLNYIKYL